MWRLAEPFPRDSQEKGTLAGEAVPAHRPSVPQHRCAAPSCPSFLPIPAGPGLKVLPNGQLHLLRASPGDAGTYLCVARNPSGTAAGRTRLIVQGKAATGPQHLALSSARLLSRHLAVKRGHQGVSKSLFSLPHPVPPVIVAGPAELAVLEGLEVLLPCAAHGIPEPRVSWSREGAPVRGGGGKATILPSGELLLRDVQVSTVPSCGQASCKVGELRNKCLLLRKRKARLFCTLPRPRLLSKIFGRGRALCSSLQQVGGSGQCGFTNVGWKKWLWPSRGFLGAQQPAEP